MLAAYRYRYPCLVPFLPTVYQIRQLVKGGLGLDKIKEVLDDDWQAEERRFHRRNVFKDVSAEMDRQTALSAIRTLMLRQAEHSLRQFGDCIAGQTDGVVDRHLADRAEALARDGYAPVLVADAEGLRVMPDFLVSHHLAEQQNPLVVIPLLAIVQRACDEAHIPIPEQRPYRPVARIERSVGKDCAEHGFVPVGEEDFEIKAATNRKGWSPSLDVRIAVHEEGSRLSSVNHEARLGGPLSLGAWRTDDRESAFQKGGPHSLFSSQQAASSEGVGC